MLKVTDPEHAFRLLKDAGRRHHPVTITYTREDGTTTVRTIEVVKITRSAAGNRYANAMTRASKPDDDPAGELRSFRLDRISALTVHRTAYKLTPPVPKSVQHPIVRPAAEILREMAAAGGTVGEYARAVSGADQWEAA